MDITKQKSVLSILLMLLLLVLMINGIYWISNRMDTSVLEDDGVITIGFLTDNLVIERWHRDQEVFRSYAETQGAEVLVLNSNENNETQIQQIRSLIEKNVDVLVIIPYDKNGLAEVIDDAKKAGIHVIAYDRLIKDANIDAYLTFDNIKVGELQAQALIEKVPTGDYVIINGSEEDNNSFMFNQGYMNVLSPFIENGNINIVAEIYAEDWREEPAYELINNLIEKGQNIDAIIGANDRLAEAAIRALAENGMAGQVYVVGHDADISACQRIVEGTQYMTVYKPIRSLAQIAVEMSIQLANEQTIDYQETINNGNYEIPYIQLDVVAVTAENMEDTVVAEGFHQRDDIYRD